MGRVVHVVRGHEFGNEIPAIEFYTIAFAYVCSLVRHVYLGTAFIWGEYWFIWRRLIYGYLLSILWIDRKLIGKFLSHCNKLFWKKFGKYIFWIMVAWALVKFVVLTMVMFPVFLCDIYKMVYKMYRIISRICLIVWCIVKFVYKVMKAIVFLFRIIHWLCCQVKTV